jgi:hypothetical protein
VCLTSADWRPPSPLVVRRKDAEVDIAPCIEELTPLTGPAGNNGLYTLILKDTESLKVRIGEVMEALFGERMPQVEIVRTALYGWNKGWKEPL